MSYVDEILDRVKAQNPNEPEFNQAVYEVLESLRGVIEANEDSLHVEYDFHRFRKENCFDISTETDSFYCYPTNPDIITKLAFATEEIYKLHISGCRTEK